MSRIGSTRQSRNKVSLEDMSRFKNDTIVS